MVSEYEENEQTHEKTFIGTVANALGAQRKGSKSEYATFETKNGRFNEEVGYASYINKAKALNYLHHSAPIAEALSNPKLVSAAKVVENFKNPEVLGKNVGKADGKDEPLYRTSAEIDAEYPNWLNGTTMESGKHSIQVDGTVAMVSGDGKRGYVVRYFENEADAKAGLAIGEEEMMPQEFKKRLDSGKLSLIEQGGEKFQKGREGIEVFIDVEEAQRVLDEENGDKVRFFRTPDGHAYGFTKDGKIYIDPRIATAETPIHEYTHLWCEAHYPIERLSH